MLKFVLIFLFASLSIAKITKNDLKLFTDYDQTLQQITKKATRKLESETNATIWVLNINDDLLNFQRLYLANKAEEKFYKKIIAPVIKNYELQHSIEVKKDNLLDRESIDQPENGNFEDGFEINNISDVKKEILKALNKFFTTQLSDPVSYLSDDVPESENKFLKLYFIGPYTSLIMTLKKLRYHYFIIPPSPLPHWFYGKHENMVETTNEKYVEIPKYVQHDFLVKLLNVLKTYTSFSV